MRARPIVVNDGTRNGSWCDIRLMCGSVVRACTLLYLYQNKQMIECYIVVMSGVLSYYTQRKNIFFIFWLVQAVWWVLRRVKSRSDCYSSNRLALTKLLIGLHFEKSKTFSTVISESTLLHIIHWWPTFLNF